MKKFFTGIGLLLMCHLLPAQEKESAPMLFYLTETAQLCPPQTIKWLQITPDFSFISLQKLKTNKLPAFGSQEIPQYVAKKTLPCFAEQTLWLCTATQVWKDSVKSAADRQKEYEKRYYFTLARFFQQNQNEQALPKAVSALADLRFSAGKEQQFELLDLLAGYCSKFRLWEEAEKYYRDALTEQLLKPEFFGYGTSALNLARTLIRQEKYDKAMQFVSFAMLEYRSAGNPQGLAECFLQEGIIAMRQQRLQEAEKIILSKALPYFTRADSNYGRMQCFGLLGELYAQQKRFSEAKWFFLQQNALSRTEKDRSAQFHSLVNLGRVKIAIKDYKLAAADLSRARIVLKSMPSPEFNLKLEETYVFLYEAQKKQQLQEQAAQKYKKLKSEWIKRQESDTKAAKELLNATRQQQTLLAAAIQPADS